ncbi:hypothetical protein C8Q79DRAFT_928548 [Trametes meyenii]|nr:hypothetical protein C8Q79DRAFT_928548 [Trametes meyenii]
MVLARLVRLIISSWDLFIVAAFLNRISVPATCDVVLYGDIAGDDDVVHTASALLPPAPARTVTFPFLASPTLTNVELVVDGPIYRIKTLSDHPMHGSLALHLIFHFSLDDWDGFFDRGVADLLDVFGAVPLTRLSFVGHLDGLSTEDWSGVLLAFPKLDTLHIFGRDSMSHLWTALKDGLKDDLDAAADVLCPHLRVVETQAPLSLDTLHAALDLLVDCLEERAARESWPQFLRLRFFSECQEDTTISIVQVYIPRLEALVEEIVYAYV